jgi:acyl-coenzyme A synthetase/AMP-(fatty) acid ligase
VLSVAASIAGVGLAPLSARVSPTLALNIFEQVDAQGIVLQADLLGAEEWQGALATMRNRLGDRPAMLLGEAPAGSAFAGLPTLEGVAASGREVSQRAWDPGRACLVLSTGGTTGQPKSVLHCEETLIWAARGMSVACEFTERDVHVAFGPYGHASG